MVPTAKEIFFSRKKLPFSRTWHIKTVYQYSFSSTIEVFFYRYNIYSYFVRVDFSQTIFSRIFSRYLLILSNSRTFPGPGKLIYFPGFPRCVGTLIINCELTESWFATPYISLKNQYDHFIIHNTICSK